MTTHEAGRAEEHYEIQFDFERICMACREEWPCLVTTQAETIREQAQAIRDHKFTLQTQAETIRRLEGMYKAAESLVQRLEANVEAERQRAEAAEGRVRELEKFLDYTARGWIGDDEHRHCDPNTCLHAVVWNERFEALEAILTPSPATGEGA